MVALHVLRRTHVYAAKHRRRSACHVSGEGVWEADGHSLEPQV